MKNITLLLALLFPFFAVTSARADRGPYHDVSKKIDGLEMRYRDVLNKRDRYGSSPRLRDEIGRIGEGLRSVKAQLEYRSASPDRISDRCDSISAVLSQAESEFHAHAREYQFDSHPRRRLIFGW